MGFLRMLLQCCGSYLHVYLELDILVFVVFIIKVSKSHIMCVRSWNGTERVSKKHSKLLKFTRVRIENVSAERGLRVGAGGPTEGFCD